MKFVLSKSRYGFAYPKGYCRDNDCHPYDFLELEGDGYEPRQLKSLIEWVHNHPDEREGLKIVEIPDNITDYRIRENDGFEAIDYVLNGLIYTA